MRSRAIPPTLVLAVALSACGGGPPPGETGPAAPASATGVGLTRQEGIEHARQFVFVARGEQQARIDSDESAG